MDRITLQIVLNECFEKEGNCAYLHLVGNGHLLIESMPNCFQTHIQVRHEYDLNGNNIIEHIHIPYKSITYMTTTTVENIAHLNEYYQSGYVME